MKQTTTSFPHTVIFDRAPTLEDLKKLPPETKSRLLLARLARIGATDRDALNKLNLMLPDDPYQLAYGYGANENDAVRQHLLGVPWTSLVNEGFLADYRGQGSFSVTDEGKEFLKIEEGVAVSSQEETDLSAFGQRARKAFDLKVGNLYQGSIQTVHDLKDQYQNEGIASAGKYLTKTADLLVNDFQGIEPAFNESYLQPFTGIAISTAGESWLLRAVDETVDRETARVKDVFNTLAPSFVGVTPVRSTPYLTQFDQLGQLTKKRLNTAVDLMRSDESALPVTPKAIAQQGSARRAWLPADWRIERDLSEGGQGWTYLVRRATAEISPLFVFKRLKNRNRAERFVAEIKALKTLSHQGILSIVETGEADGMPYYVAEYCENGDLSKWEPTKATLLEKVKLFHQIVDAVSAAHAAKIIHRDLKPFNILVRANGSVAVGDFGLCIHLNDLDGRLTTLNEPVGPRNYMAPELEDGRLEDPEPSADVYSLGKLLYFILSGRSFSREKHRTAPFDLLHPDHGNVEAGVYFVYGLLDKSIVADPEARYGDATALRQALDGVIMKIESNANVLNLSVRQQCLYCREGYYRVMHGTSPDQHNLKLVCSNCGNFQEFVSQNTVARDWWSSK
jgi:serine/threonine protein kinase